MRVFYDKDADMSVLQGKTVAIIGYGSQGHAHANNLHDSGVNVVVGLREGGVSWPKAEKAGLAVKPVKEAVKNADVVMILLPDENIADLYKQIEGDIKEGAALAFATVSTCITAKSARAKTWTSSWSPRKRPATPCAVPIRAVVAYRI